MRNPFFSSKKKKKKKKKYNAIFFNRNFANFMRYLSFLKGNKTYENNDLIQNVLEKFRKKKATSAKQAVLLYIMHFSFLIITIFIP